MGLNKWINVNDKTPTPSDLADILDSISVNILLEYQCACKTHSKTPQFTLGGKLLGETFNKPLSSILQKRYIFMVLEQ